MEHTLGQRLRAYRKAAGLTASRLAHAAGVTEDAIRKIESGRSKQPSFTTGVQIARALGVSPLILATGDAPAPLTPTEPQTDLLARTIAALREKREELQAIGVQHAAVFGSVARGDSDDESDVDIVIKVDPESSFSLLDRAGVRIELGDELGRSVDVVNASTMRDSRYEHIFKEAIDAF